MSPRFPCTEAEKLLLMWFFCPWALYDHIFCPNACRSIDIVAAYGWNKLFAHPIKNTFETGTLPANQLNLQGCLLTLLASSLQQIAWGVFLAAANLRQTALIGWLRLKRRGIFLKMLEAQEIGEFMLWLCEFGLDIWLQVNEVWVQLPFTPKECWWKWKGVNVSTVQSTYKLYGNVQKKNQ